MEDAVELEVETVIVITGGLSKKRRDLACQSQKVLEELEWLIGQTKGTGLKLALEPLHQMVCGLRSVVSSLSQAKDILDRQNHDDVMAFPWIPMQYGGM